MTNPCACKKCGHDMGRSRLRMWNDVLGVRCNRCKTVYEVEIVPKDSKRRWIAVCSCGDSLAFGTKAEALAYIIAERERISRLPNFYDDSRHTFTIVREPKQTV